jgi:antitoxin (DNA-binding transcriptional repressor) of toxin-antitoxin stability system
MRIVTLAELRRQFSEVFSWILAGERVEVARRGKVVAHILPALPPKLRRFKIPAFAQRAEAILGASFRQGLNLVEEERSS